MNQSVNIAHKNIASILLLADAAALSPALFAGVPTAPAPPPPVALTPTVIEVSEVQEQPDPSRCSASIPIACLDSGGGGVTSLDSLRATRLVHRKNAGHGGRQQ
jgi:hypothetical protein